MPEFSGSFSGRATLQTTIIASDVPDHQLNLAEIPATRNGTTHSSRTGASPTLSPAAVSSAATSSTNIPTEAGTGVRSRVKVTTAGSETTLEGTWAFSGGTGKFTGITGQGTYRGRMPSANEVEMSWEGQYDLAVSARAA